MCLFSDYEAENMLVKANGGGAALVQRMRWARLASYV